jgi:DNA primase
MTIQELKKYIFENNKIECVLEVLGCHNIKHHDKHDYFSASFPDGDNPQGINIRNNEYLNYRSFSRGVDYDEGKDIVSLVEYITKKNFVESIKYLHSILGLEYKWQKKQDKQKEKINPNSVFTRVLRSKKKIDVEEIHAIDEEMLNDYIPLLHVDWLREGIMPWTAKKFGLAYSYKRKRVIIPMRYWMTGELLGINARTTVENYEQLGIKKFFLTPSYQKNLNLFGLYENYEAIQKAGYVVVYEAEKSVMKRDSLNDPTGVALSGHTLSDEQANILWGLGVDIIISMDNDVPIEEIRHMCSKLHTGRNVYYTYDKWNLLGEKDSIADMPNKIFNFMMKYKIKYDANEHREYLKSLERK